jgi:hypothetical protein
MSTDVEERTIGKWKVNIYDAVIGHTATAWGDAPPPCAKLTVPRVGDIPSARGQKSLKC